VTRETAASTRDQATTGRNGHAPASWLARPAPLLPRALPMTGPGLVKPPAASSTGQAGQMRPRPRAGLPVRRDLRTRRNQPAPCHGCRPAQAPEGGADVTGLARMTRRARTRLGRYRRRPAGAGRAIGVRGGRRRVRRPRRRSG
jgi:hypothetical protein